MAGAWQVGRLRIDRRLGVVLTLGLCLVVLAAVLTTRAVGLRDPKIHVGAVQDPGTALPASISGSSPAGPGGELHLADVGVGAADGAGVRDGPGLRRPVRPTGGGRAVSPRLLDPTGRPYGAPIPFRGSIPVPAGLVWVLLVGSDARPGEPVLRSRADSIHLLAANPTTGQATIIGFPRDSFVEIPGHGAGKINTALVLGGPELLAKTINRFTGLPVQLWVVAGFEGFTRVVDEVGGLDVAVPTAMADRDSGAYFRPGVHHFDGGQALAFSRDRHDFADGDLSRSRNHGVVMLAALAKLRAEVGDEAGLHRWAAFAFRHLSVDLDLTRAVQLLAVARRTDPALVTNLVLPGRGGMAGAQSVVYLDPAGVARIVDDVRPDAAIGPATQPLLTTSSTTAPPPATSSTTPPPSTAPPEPAPSP